MRNKIHILTILGIGIYVIYSLINRFVYEIPDWFGLPLLITTMSMIIIGALIQQRKYRK
ncbi:MAG TPA: hypothetical protein VLM88_04530 [Proteiniclasticum sp.]|nr:hypothetical protein [Proteiniclasticum sp.]